MTASTPTPAEIARRLSPVEEAFQRNPFTNPPPCMRDHNRTCLPHCEYGIVGPCAIAVAVRAELERMEARDG